MKFKKALGLLALFGVSGTLSSVQAAPAQVKSVSPQSLKAEIARNKGKVVVVNFWATWCSPCVKELPALAQLQSRNAKKGAVLLLVSVDDPGAKKKAAEVAGQRGHRTTRLINSDIDVFFNSFDPKTKNGEAITVPRTYIFNRKGKLVKVTADEEHTLPQFQKMIAPHL